MPKTETPPPGVVHEFAEKAVDAVRRALGIALDYTPETLPVLDHYLGQVPRDQPEMVRLVAATAGAYFGETVRRSLGGRWENVSDEPGEWLLVLTGDVRFAPVGFCAEAIVLGGGPHRAPLDEGDATDRSAPLLEGYEGAFEVPPRDRDFVEQALDSRGPVPEGEFYSLCGRLETLTYVVELLVARRADPRAGKNGRPQ